VLETNRNKKQRRKIAVNLDTGDGDELVYMFVFPTERVIDTLNDDRDFLPFERPDGSTSCRSNGRTARSPSSRKRPSSACRRWIWSARSTRATRTICSASP
jgi:hypothetical protein